MAATSGATGTVTVENSYAVGVTYVTTAGDSTVTIGAGYNQADYSNSQTATKDERCLPYRRDCSYWRLNCWCGLF